jgi:hypothetical protein
MCPEVRDALLTLTEQNFYTITTEEFAARIERAKAARLLEQRAAKERTFQ